MAEGFCVHQAKLVAIGCFSIFCIHLWTPLLLVGPPLPCSPSCWWCFHSCFSEWWRRYKQGTCHTWIFKFSCGAVCLISPFPPFLMLTCLRTWSPNYLVYVNTLLCNYFTWEKIERKGDWLGWANFIALVEAIVFLGSSSLSLLLACVVGAGPIAFLLRALHCFAFFLLFIW